jgi:hypothetical protein
MQTRKLDVERFNPDTQQWERAGTAHVPYYLALSDEEALRDVESYLTMRQRLLERPHYRDQQRYRAERVRVMRMRDRLNAILSAKAA